MTVPARIIQAPLVRNAPITILLLVGSCFLRGWRATQAGLRRPGASPGDSRPAGPTGAALLRPCHVEGLPGPPRRAQGDIQAAPRCVQRTAQCSGPNRVSACGAGALPCALCSKEGPRRLRSFFFKPKDILMCYLLIPLHLPSSLNSTLITLKG